MTFFKMDLSIGLIGIWMDMWVDGRLRVDEVVDIKLRKVVYMRSRSRYHGYRILTVCQHCNKKRGKAKRSMEV